MISFVFTFHRLIRDPNHWATPPDFPRKSRSTKPWNSKLLTTVICESSSQSFPANSGIFAPEHFALESKGHKFVSWNLHRNKLNLLLIVNRQLLFISSKHSHSPVPAWQWTQRGQPKLHYTDWAHHTRTLKLLNMALKRTKSNRLKLHTCVDYRNLNDLIITHCFLLLCQWHCGLTRQRIIVSHCYYRQLTAPSGHQSNQKSQNTFGAPHD